jgi:hypothetical protein
MFEGHPEKLFLCINGRDVLPIANNSLLHPAKIHGIVDMTHVVDVAWRYRDPMLECWYL